MQNNLCSKEVCTACGACMNICLKDAITLKFENNGFYHAVIDNNKCINCGLCSQVCPQINRVANNNYTEPQCYAYWAKDEIRKVSSSGGAFTVLAEYILQQGGMVYGCAYDENLMPCHIGIQNVSELSRLRKSKYTQSYVGFSYREVKEELENGRIVLFTGVPCQIAGLKAFLRKEYENLYTIDILCSGNAPIGVYKNYVAELEKKHKKRISDIDFRNKEFGWCCGHLTVNFDDGTVYKEKNNLYMQAFIKGVFRTGACKSCNAAEFPRYADVTIGDFWNIEKYNKDLADGNGTSLVTINSAKGQELFNNANVQSQSFLCEPIDFTFTKHSNWFTKERAEKDEMKHLYALLQTHTVHESLERVLKNKYDICVIGNWSGYNYGAHLTHYALYQTLIDNGYDVLMVEKPDQEPFRPLPLPTLFRNNPYPVYALSKLYNDISHMRELNQISDTFIVGSDQLWNWDLFGHGMECYTLAFTEAEKKRISYATSFGSNKVIMPRDKQKIMNAFLKRFQRISVREQSGVSICSEIFGVEATCVLDPVFLCDKKHYLGFVENATIKPKEKYIFCYVIHPLEKTILFINELAKKLSMKVVCVGDALPRKNDKYIHVDFVTDIKVEDWLSLLYHSEYVIADSFHAYCFSLIFNKQIFSVFPNSAFAERVKSISNILGTKNPIVFEETEILDIDNLLKENYIDYTIVNGNIKKEKEKSLKWLLSAVNEKCITPDLTLELLVENEFKVKQLEAEVSKLTFLLSSTSNGMHNENNVLKNSVSNQRHLDKEIQFIKSELNELKNKQNANNFYIQFKDKLMKYPKTFAFMKRIKDKMLR